MYSTWGTVLIAFYKSSNVIITTTLGVRRNPYFPSFQTRTNEGSSEWWPCCVWTSAWVMLMFRPLSSHRAASLEARCRYVSYAQGKLWHVTNKMTQCGMKEIMWQQGWGLYVPFPARLWRRVPAQEVGKESPSAHNVFSGAWLRQKPSDCRDQSEVWLISSPPCLVSASDKWTPEGSPVEAADGKRSSDQTKTHPLPSDALPFGFCALVFVTEGKLNFSPTQFYGDKEK